MKNIRSVLYVIQNRPESVVAPDFNSEAFKEAQADMEKIMEGMDEKQRQEFMLNITPAVLRVAHRAIKKAFS